MALLTVEGVYKEGRIELSETPSGIAETTRVLVTFLPATGTASGGEVETRNAAMQRLIERLKQGIDFGGPPYPKREELYDRTNRSGERDG
jgi:hypothetical protein